MNNLSDQKRGSLMAFIAVLFITPDALFIRLSEIDTWGLVFYRGFIPFITVFIGMIIIYRIYFFKWYSVDFMLVNNGQERTPCPIPMIKKIII